MLKSIHLINFKAFDDQTVELRPLTLLTGLNGMGKSTVLQALLLLRQSTNYRMMDGTGEISEIALNGDYVQLGNPSDVLYERAKSDSIEIRLAFDPKKIPDIIDGYSGSLGDETVSDSWIEEEGDYILPVEYVWVFEYDRDREVLDIGDSTSGTGREKTDQYRLTKTWQGLYNLASLFNEDFAYLAAERLGPRKISETTITDSIGKYGEYAVHQLHKLRDQKVTAKLCHPQSASDTLVDNVEAWLGEVSPGVRIRLDFFRNIDAIQSLFAFQTGRDVSNFYRATNVGFGITYVLPVLVAILSATPQSLILLENPEAHLHPRGQARLGELLACAADAGIQVIVETHSDHILNGIRVATKKQDITADKIAIHYFAREEGHRTYYSIPIDNEGNIERWPEGFFDEYENMLTKLL